MVPASAGSSPDARPWCATADHEPADTGQFSDGETRTRTGGTHDFQSCSPATQVQPICRGLPPLDRPPSCPGVSPILRRFRRRYGRRRGSWPFRRDGLDVPQQTRSTRLLGVGDDDRAMSGCGPPARRAGRRRASFSGGTQATTPRASRRPAPSSRTSTPKRRGARPISRSTRPRWSAPPWTTALLTSS